MAARQIEHVTKFHATPLKTGYMELLVYIWYHNVNVHEYYREDAVVVWLNRS